MKRAIVSAAALEVQCPECNECQANPEDGSHLWSSSQLAESIQLDSTRTCLFCAAQFRISMPKTVKVV